LAEWIGEQIRAYEKEPELAAFLESLAQEEFARIEKEENPLHQWTKFMTHFRSHPLAAIAGEKRLELLANRRQTTEMEMLAKIATSNLMPRLGDFEPVESVETQEANRELLVKLARHFEEAGRFSDAFFYYRLLGAHDAEEALKNPVYQSLAFAKTWPGGTFVLDEDESEQAEKFRSEWLAETHNPMVGYYPGRLTVGAIPLVARVSPFFEGSEFTLLSDPNVGLSIICRDPAGQKLWTLEIPQDFPDEADSARQVYFLGNNSGYDYYSYNNAPQSGCLVAYRHLLYYLRGKRIVAIDTLKRDRSGTPTVLWTRTNQSSLAGFRVFRSAMSVDLLNNEAIQYRGQEKNSLAHPLFVNSQVLCFQDFETLYGVDPLTGEVIWTRSSLSDQSYLTGDEESVYQLRPTGAGPGNACEAIAIDPATGKETAKGKLPQGFFHCFGSTFVCPGRQWQSGGEQCIEVYDLKDCNKAFEMARAKKEFYSKVLFII